MSVYKLFWDDFASWYLEIIKPEFQKPIDKATHKATIDFFDKLLKILHPFMPFISEEIWQLSEERNNGESIMLAEMPESRHLDYSVLADFELVKETITAIRAIRTEKNISPKEPLNLYYKADHPAFSKEFNPIIIKLGNISEIKTVNEKVEDAATFIIKSAEFYVPVGSLINKEEEIKKLKSDLEYAKGFLSTVEKKLSNERFVKNAPPQVLAIEQQKKSDAESKIRILEERIAGLI